MNWYNQIDNDEDFLYYIENSVARYGRDMRQHPRFRQFAHQTMRMAHPNPDPYGPQQSIVSQLEGDGMVNLGESIGTAIFVYLLEHNPTLIQSIITGAMQTSHNHSTSAAAQALYMQGATQACGFTDESDDVQIKKVTVPPDNDDYEYWYDFNSSEDAVIVTCDLWADDEQEDFIQEFEFEFDDEDEKQSALDEAEKLVRQLSSGEVQLVDLIGNIPVSTNSVTAQHIRDTISKSSLTDKILQMDYLPLAPTPPTKPVQFKTSFGTTMPSLKSSALKYTIT